MVFYCSNEQWKAKPFFHFGLWNLKTNRTFFISNFFYSISSSNISFTRYWAPWFICFTFYEVFQSYDPGCKFYKLAKLTRVIFILFLIIFFLNFILQHWVYYGLGFIIVFFMFFLGIIKVLWLRSRVFQVSHINFGFFLSFFNWIFFFNFILQYWIDWELEFFIFIFFYRVISISWPGFDRLIIVVSC